MHKKRKICKTKHICNNNIKNYKNKLTILIITLQLVKIWRM